MVLVTVVLEGLWGYSTLWGSQLRPEEAAAPSQARDSGMAGGPVADNNPDGSTFPQKVLNAPLVCTEEEMRLEGRGEALASNLFGAG